MEGGRVLTERYGIIGRSAIRFGFGLAASFQIWSLDLCQPVIAGLGDDDKPFICTMDSIGAKELARDFVVSGTASESLYGACEAMFKPDMDTNRG